MRPLRRPRLRKAGTHSSHVRMGKRRKCNGPVRDVWATMEAEFAEVLGLDKQDMDF